MYVVLNFGRGHYRQTTYNPDGGSEHYGLWKNPGNSFFQSVLFPALEPFSERIAKLDLTDKVPESFLDPITCIIMDNPVIASDQITYDLSTLQKLNYISPFSKVKLSTNVTPNLALRAEMEDFIKNKGMRPKK